MAAHERRVIMGVDVSTNPKKGDIATAVVVRVEDDGTVTILETQKLEFDFHVARVGRDWSAFARVLTEQMREQSKFMSQIAGTFIDPPAQVGGTARELHQQLDRLALPPGTVWPVAKAFSAAVSPKSAWTRALLPLMRSVSPTMVPTPMPWDDEFANVARIPPEEPHVESDEDREYRRQLRRMRKVRLPRYTTSADNGVRHPEHPCDVFVSSGETDEKCEGDGHYLCWDCGHHKLEREDDL